jgi:hypothetical protein
MSEYTHNGKNEGPRDWARQYYSLGVSLKSGIACQGQFVSWCLWRPFVVLGWTPCPLRFHGTESGW